MARSATHKLHAYLALVAVLLITAWAARLPELGVVATPFAVLLVVGLAQLQPVAHIEAEVELPSERAMEGEELELELKLRADRDLPVLELVPSVPAGLAFRASSLLVTDLRRGEPRSLGIRVRLKRWGVFTTVSVELRAAAPLGFFEDRGSLQSRFALRVYPRPETLRAMIRPRETEPSAGNLVARGVGSGIEFSEVRPFRAGDERRHVNWRTTARRNELWVNARRPERNADLILFLDTFTRLGTPRGSALDLAVRAAAALAGRHLHDRDRVGVVGFGGTLSWLRPGTGERQLYQISEALIATEVSFSYAWKDVTFIPYGTLPPQSTVVALSPLVDDRFVQALFDLLRRGFDVCVFEVTPELFLPAPKSERGRLARRVWRMERETLLDRYRELGASVVSLTRQRSLNAAVLETLRFRHQARVVAGR